MSSSFRARWPPPPARERPCRRAEESRLTRLLTRGRSGEATERRSESFRCCLSHVANPSFSSPSFGSPHLPVAPSSLQPSSAPRFCGLFPSFISLTAASPPSAAVSCTSSRSFFLSATSGASGSLRRRPRFEPRPRFPASRLAPLTSLAPSSLVAGSAKEGGRLALPSQLPLSSLPSLCRVYSAVRAPVPPACCSSPVSTLLGSSAAACLPPRGASLPRRAPISGFSAAVPRSFSPWRGQLPAQRLGAKELAVLEDLFVTIRESTFAEAPPPPSCDDEAGASLGSSSSSRSAELSAASSARRGGGGGEARPAQFALFAALFPESLLSSLEAFVNAWREKEVLTQLLADSHEALCGCDQARAAAPLSAQASDAAPQVPEEKRALKRRDELEEESLPRQAKEEERDDLPSFLTDDADWVAAHLEACRSEEVFLEEFYVTRAALRQGLAQVRDACSPQKEKKDEGKKDKQTFLLDPEEDETALQGDAVLEIQAGVGGEDAALFSRDLFGMYEAFAASRGLDAFRFLSLEAGIHRVQRVPPTEARGRMQTSATAVTVLPRSSNLEDRIDLSPPNLKIDFMRASGPGGQSVNKSETAVRITHKPTGTSVHCMRTQSQTENKSLALELLRAQLLQQLVRQAMEERGKALDAQKGSKDRSEKIRTYNFQRDVVTDHRCRMHVQGVKNFLDSSDGLLPILEVLMQSREDAQIADLLGEIKATLDLVR
ncbi:peptidyl-tRNA hydrolase domain-containing protein [Besnoitia besnoiti]|uniref:Peptidyl-tRNA hydrolase domain-containing protein n=1 Tax=Besnoitia besnoiti TaxID=94643 RepID=A0A2A9M8Y3_BESBE|nr:peptidyl-tRNA hydrolase domain-containing protein [Besnoitia besnoiti]PFH34359.1 peptidyl-tRNA hydrolase domain-containing protein [Besnoitia besnoiti]